jgi:hypothetical protein
VVVDNFTLVNPDVPRATYFRRTAAQPTAILQEICQFHTCRWENLWLAEGLGGSWVGL